MSQAQLAELQMPEPWAAIASASLYWTRSAQLCMEHSKLPDSYCLHIRYKRYVHRLVIGVFT